MTALLLTLAPLLPLGLAPLVALGGSRRWLPLAALPALAVALAVPLGSGVELAWLLLGTHLVLDDTARLFLLFSGLVWFAVALHLALDRAPERERGNSGTWFLLAMGGNHLLILAADMVTFYLGFALMGLAAYGLVVAGPGQRARRAGRVYLGFTLAGEMALFAALVILVDAAGSSLFSDLAGRDLPDAAVALLLLGFGVKVALPGLHRWLPLAYGAAPIAAVAVLSGPMMKAGLLGWLRFLPAEAVVAPGWGRALVVLGALGILLGVVLGVAQRRPRTVLAYSSIAKMGLMSALFGGLLIEPTHAPAAAAALVLFAMHHLLVKSMLFLGVGAWERYGARPWVTAGLAVLAASMAGLPFSGGAAAKAALVDASQGMQLAAGLLLAGAALGTAVLMLRLLFLVWRGGTAAGPVRRAPAVVWVVMLPPAFWGPFAPWDGGFEPSALWPPAAALLLAGLWWMLSRHHPALSLRLPRVDALRPLARASGRLWHAASTWQWPVVRLPAPRVAGTGATGGRGIDLAGAGLRWFAVLLALLAATWSPL